MNKDHYAIVVGLSKYSELGPPPADLKGPGNDADAVYAWLTEPKGGGLPRKNVRLIKSSNFKPPKSKPTRVDLEEAFLWIEGIANSNPAGRRVGSRLYLYLSGHGFSPERRKGCLLAGDARINHATANVGASLWLQWWQDAGYFNEFVLWMDCCMNRVMQAVPGIAPLIPIMTGSPAGPSFIAFAAQRPLKAVEMKIPADGNKVHGVFTWSLLQGLKGRAADETGTVTGRSLADWLRNAILPWLSDADRSDPDVSQAPEIAAEDAALVFAKGLAPHGISHAVTAATGEAPAKPARRAPDGALVRCQVKLRFPAKIVGKMVRLWSGAPPQTHEFKVKREVIRRLPVGLYVVEVIGTPYRHGFEVTRACQVDVAQTGAPVKPSPTATTFALTVEPRDATARIVVVGTRLELVKSQNGRLKADLPFGIYKIRLKMGRQITETVILLDDDFSPSLLRPGDDPYAGATSGVLSVPRIPSAAPLAKSATSHEYQRQAAANVTQSLGSQTHASLDKGATLIVMARSWSGKGAKPDLKPWAGVEIADQKGTVVLDLCHQGRHNTSVPDPFAIATVALTPGVYSLRHRLPNGDRIEQSLILPPGGWQLEAYILRRSIKRDTVEQCARVSLLMRRMPGPESVLIGQHEWGASEDTLLEKARIALADERQILNPELDALLLQKFDNPLAGILGGHLLLLENPKGKRLELLNWVVEQGRKLVGRNHPDIEALSLKCPKRELRTKGPIEAPPLFERSWQLIVEGSQHTPKLVPLSLWQKVHAMVSMPPYLVWSVNADVQGEYRRALAEATFGPQAPTLEARGTAGRAPSAHPAAMAAPGPASIPRRAPSAGAHAEMAPMSVPRDDVAPALESLTTRRTTRRHEGVPQLAAEVKRRAAALHLPPVALSALRQEYEF